MKNLTADDWTFDDNRTGQTFTKVQELVVPKLWKDISAASTNTNTKLRHRFVAASYVVSKVVILLSIGFGLVMIYKHNLYEAAVAAILLAYSINMYLTIRRDISKISNERRNRP